jgi:predicted component of type VI protein secretion system
LVTMVESEDHQFSFRISGLLRMDTGVEPVAYDADLPKESRRFRVLAGR